MVYVVPYSFPDSDCGHDNHAMEPKILVDLIEDVNVDDLPAENGIKRESSGSKKNILETSFVDEERGKEWELQR